MGLAGRTQRVSKSHMNSSPLVFANALRNSHADLSKRCPFCVGVIIFYRGLARDFESTGQENLEEKLIEDSFAREIFLSILAQLQPRTANEYSALDNCHG